MDNKLTLLTPEECKQVIRRFVKANVKASKKGKQRIAVCFEGESGVGKTSVPAQVAKELDAAYYCLVLSQIEDIGDLVGYPYMSYEMSKDISPTESTLSWFNEKYARIQEAHGWNYTGRCNAQYAPPEWLSVLYEKPLSILVLDDFTRADPRWQQAIMQLNQTGAYYSWKLPEGCTIVLTSNPDDGEYLVNTQDSAMSGRYAKFGVKFDIDDWAKWATENDIDGRCVNVMIHGYRELLYHKDPAKHVEGKMVASPRDWSNLFEFLSDDFDFSSPGSHVEILKYGKAFVGDNINVFVQALTQGIDKIPGPDSILFTQNWKKINDELIACCGALDDRANPYKAEIGAIVATRLQYYLLRYLENYSIKDTIDQFDSELNKISSKAKSSTSAETMEERLAKIFDSKFISKEAKTGIMKILFAEYGSKLSELFIRKEFKDSLLSAYSSSETV